MRHIPLSYIRTAQSNEIDGAQKILSGHVVSKRTFLTFIHLFHYVIIQHEKDTIGRKILMFLLSVNTTFTLAILFSLIL